MSDKESPAGENQTVEVKLEPRKIYIKDVSFESPQSPDIFSQGEVSPSMDIQMMLHHKQLNNNFHEVVLETTVTSKLEDKTLFLIELQQAGIFEIDCSNPRQLEMIKEIACPNILLPFARETIADLVAKGGFPQLLLNPVNFEALYQQKKQKEQQSQQTPSSTAVN